jgi:hypothetical protein
VEAVGQRHQLGPDAGHPGEVVVTGGVQFLVAGMQVRLPQDVLRTAAAQPSAEPSR